ncbi:MAG: cyclase family protein, partial [Sneathiella sp.]
MPSIIDISQTLSENLPVWPGDTPFSVDAQWEIGTTCPVRVSRLILSTHSGTHADAPSHYDPSGIHIADTDLLPYLGPCHVVHATTGDNIVSTDKVLSALKNLGGIPKRVLIRTFDTFPHAHWPTPFKSIDPALIHALAEEGCLLIGTDTP